MGDLTRDDKICLKELDHLQAIVARYDQFFFLNKQLSLVAFGVLIYSCIGEGKPVVLLLPCVPLVFLVIEVTFRYYYWTRKMLRIRDLRLHLQGVTDGAFKLYMLNSRAANWRQRFSESVKKFDLFFYAVMFMIGIAFLITQEVGDACA